MQRDRQRTRADLEAEFRAVADKKLREGKILEHHHAKYVTATYFQPRASHGGIIKAIECPRDHDIVCVGGHSKGRLARLEKLLLHLNADLMHSRGEIDEKEHDIRTAKERFPRNASATTIRRQCAKDKDVITGSGGSSIAIQTKAGLRQNQQDRVRERDMLLNEFREVADRKLDEGGILDDQHNIFVGKIFFNPRTPNSTIRNAIKDLMAHDVVCPSVKARGKEARLEKTKVCHLADIMLYIDCINEEEHRDRKASDRFTRKSAAIIRELGEGDKKLLTGGSSIVSSTRDVNRQRAKLKFNTTRFESMGCISEGLASYIEIKYITRGTRHQHIGATELNLALKALEIIHDRKKEEENNERIVPWDRIVCYEQPPASIENFEIIIKKLDQHGFGQERIESTDDIDSKVMTFKLQSSHVDKIKGMTPILLSYEVASKSRAWNRFRSGRSLLLSNAI